ncbi:endonuclease/exonuclease/phosphatase family protein [Streptomyces shenzhenensis]|uniref:endonuclease/exonuclease/phosphatase family protein n=1 Tax=Streptomyces shenzhenensis TaxID=943815 RepID=UPI0033E0DFA9
MSESRTVTRRTALTGALSAALIASFASTTLVAPAASGAENQSPELQIMTYNLEGHATAGPSWAKRRPVERALLQQAQPHVVGTQEGDYKQVQQVASDLGKNYAWIGTGANGGRKGVINAIFYDVRRLKPVASNTFWLSSTPHKVGSNTWGAAHIRTATWIRFKDKQDGGREFIVLNTHLDNKSQNARLKSATLLGQKILNNPPSMPILVTGDFNCAAHKNEVYTRLLKRGKLVDTWDTAATRNNEYGTFTGHRKLTPNGDRIDWILSTSGVTTDRTETNIFSKDGLFPSDHLPVQAWVQLR